MMLLWYTVTACQATMAYSRAESQIDNTLEILASSPVSSSRALNVAWLAPSRAVIYRLEAELRRPVHRWPVTLLMRLQQALLVLHPHPMESNPACAQTGVTMLERINFHRVRAQYPPAARLEQPLLVSSVSRELPNARRFQGQTCSVSCEDFKIYIYLVSGSGPIKSVLEIHQIDPISYFTP